MALRHLVAFGALVFLLGPAPAAAQPLGTFKWQLQPHCNVLTVAVTQNAGVFELEGTDDQCGVPGTRASAIGTAFINADGTVGMGLSIVTSPGGAAVHVDAAITVATLGGTWRDSAGHTGSLVFTPGAGTGGSPRPAPTTGVLPGSVEGAHINAAQVQRRITDSCSTGSFMRSVGEDGSVACGFETGDVSAVAAGAGLTGGGSSGAVTLALPTTPSGALLFSNPSGFAAVATGSGSIPVSGAGRRAMWDARNAAFRAGEVTGTQWDAVNVGPNSVAFGRNARAIGSESVAMGFETSATGPSAVAMGEVTTASGKHAFAMGDRTLAAGGNSVALGALASATGPEAIAMGTRVTAGGAGSVVLGSDAFTTSSAAGSFVFADRSTTSDFGTFAPNSFLVRAAGGTRIFSDPDLRVGVTLARGASAWASISDVNMKENFRDLGGDDVLSKLAGMPIREWNYKAQAAEIRHVGPTAQDFHAAFGLGEDPLRISTIDADGVALRAIQALEARTRGLEETNETLREELAALREELEAVKTRKQ